MPKKTIEQFKDVFAPVRKKPKRPNVVSAKDKSLIETDVAKQNLGDLKQHLTDLYGKNPAYAADLVAYKIAKHMDDPKVQVWLRDIPDDLARDAVQKIIPNDLSDPATERQYRKAQAGKNMVMLQLFNKRDGQGCTRLNNQDVAAENTGKIKDAFARSDAAKIEKLGGSFTSIVKAGDPVALASANPTAFFAVLMKGFKEDVAGFAEAFGNKTLRDDLKRACPAEWKTFAATVPMLATLDAVDDKLRGKTAPTEADQLDALFDSILDPSVMPLTYVATLGGYRNIDIMTGPTKSNAAALQNLKDTTGAPGPATDCHNLQNLTMRMIEASLGKKVPRAVEAERDDNGDTVAKGKAKGMVLTRPLGEIGDKGLIGSFGGNVFDDKNNPTGQVFFTGDGGGQDSHSWLVIRLTDSKDGRTKEIEFDPVLGTKGAEVIKAIQEENIVWEDAKRKIARTPNGLYLVLDPEKKCGTNQIGISTYYNLLKTAPEELEA